jgi:hypothetical protein
MACSFRELTLRVKLNPTLAATLLRLVGNLGDNERAFLVIKLLSPT